MPCLVSERLDRFQRGHDDKQVFLAAIDRMDQRLQCQLDLVWFTILDKCLRGDYLYIRGAIL